MNRLADRRRPPRTGRARSGGGDGRHVGSERPSKTAEVAATFRAGARSFPPEQRPIDDAYAQLFVPRRFRMLSAAPPVGRLLARLTDRVYPGMIGEVVLRCRYADDRLHDAVRSGVTQAIMLGSGYDTTALRLRALPVRFFEVDQPAMLARKRAVIGERVSAQAAGAIRFVPCRFDQDSLRRGLASNGYEGAWPAFVSWLAVTWYLSAEAIERTLRDLAALLAPGSSLVIDYLHRAAADGTHSVAGVRRSRRAARRRGEPWTFGIDPQEIGPWLARLGFIVEDHLTAAELTRRYFPHGVPLAGADYVGLLTARRTSA